MLEGVSDLFPAALPLAVSAELDTSRILKVVQRCVHQAQQMRLQTVPDFASRSMKRRKETKKSFTPFAIERHTGKER